MIKKPKQDYQLRGRDIIPAVGLSEYLKRNVYSQTDLEESRSNHRTIFLWGYNALICGTTGGLMVAGIEALVRQF